MFVLFTTSLRLIRVNHSLRNAAVHKSADRISPIQCQTTFAVQWIDASEFRFDFVIRSPIIYRCSNRFYFPRFKLDDTLSERLRKIATIKLETVYKPISIENNKLKLRTGPFIIPLTSRFISLVYISSNHSLSTALFLVSSAFILLVLIARITPSVRPDRPVSGDRGRIPVRTEGSIRSLHPGKTRVRDCVRLWGLMFELDTSILYVIIFFRRINPLWVQLRASLVAFSDTTFSKRFCVGNHIILICI